ncbi:MAG: hypothetical protein K2Y23_07070 [Cyanobacteria bacterium]|nr:hypothetical protein [Cyanobacteriota bacterium]
MAVTLDRLLHRDGHSISEAVSLVRAQHGSTLSERELREICGQLPKRQQPREVPEQAADDVTSEVSSESIVEDEARQTRVEQLQRALQAAFGQLAHKDRVTIAFRYDQDLPITQIATMTGLSAPTLHRRIDRSLTQLRTALLAAGFSPREIRDLIGHPEIALSSLLKKEIESFSGSVRLFKRDG